jgi:hypothetical protein
MDSSLPVPRPHLDIAVRAPAAHAPVAEVEFGAPPAPEINRHERVAFIAYIAMAGLLLAFLMGTSAVWLVGT